MKKLNVTVEPRKLLGKKVKKLRREGILPANLFGKGIKSRALQIQEKDFRPIFKAAGETGVVEVKVKNETFPSLIHNVQRDPISGKATHVDFHKVNLKERISAHVPIKLIGEAPAEKSGIGLLLQTINELEIESLPTDIPQQIEVDVSKLEEVGQTVQVKDLEADREKVDVKNNSEDVVVSVQTAEMKEEPKEEEAPSPEEVEATAEKPEEEAEKPAEEMKEEPKEEAKEEKTQEDPS